MRQKEINGRVFYKQEIRLSVYASTLGFLFNVIVTEASEDYASTNVMGKLHIRSPHFSSSLITL